MKQNITLILAIIAIAMVPASLYLSSNKLQTKLQDYAKKDSIAVVVENATADMATKTYVREKIVDLNRIVSSAYPTYEEVFGRSSNDLQLRISSIDTLENGDLDTNWEMIPAVEIAALKAKSVPPEIARNWRLGETNPVPAQEQKAPPVAATKKRKSIF
jgi:hypothetical protein